MNTQFLISLAALSDSNFDGVGLNAYSEDGYNVGIFVGWLDGAAGILEVMEDGVEEWHPSLTFVSLTDSATRDRLMRWLAGKVNLELGNGGCFWYIEDFRWSHKYTLESMLGKVIFDVGAAGLVAGPPPGTKIGEVDYYDLLTLKQAIKNIMRGE